MVQTGLGLCTIVCLGVVTLEECMRMMGSLPQHAHIIHSLQMVVLRKLRLHLADIAAGEASLHTTCPRLDAQICFEAMSVVAWKAGLCKQVQRVIKGAHLQVKMKRAVLASILSSRSHHGLMPVNSSMHKPAGIPRRSAQLCPA